MSSHRILFVIAEITAGTSANMVAAKVASKEAAGCGSLYKAKHYIYYVETCKINCDSAEYGGH